MGALSSLASNGITASIIAVLSEMQSLFVAGLTSAAGGRLPTFPLQYIVAIVVVVVLIAIIVFIKKHWAIAFIVRDRHGLRF
jgi:hypothetical protein